MKLGTRVALNFVAVSPALKLRFAQSAVNFLTGANPTTFEFTTSRLERFFTVK
jgi:hypothetical protein